MWLRTGKHEATQRQQHVPSLQSNITHDQVLVTGALQPVEWRQEGWVIQQNLPGVVSLVSQSFYDASWGRWKWSGWGGGWGWGQWVCCCSVQVFSQRRRLVKTGRSPPGPELTHIKGRLAAAITHQAVLESQHCLISCWTGLYKCKKKKKRWWSLFNNLGASNLKPTTGRMANHCGTERV